MCLSLGWALPHSPGRIHLNTKAMWRMLLLMNSPEGGWWWFRLELSFLEPRARTLIAFCFACVCFKIHFIFHLCVCVCLYECVPHVCGHLWRWEEHQVPWSWTTICPSSASHSLTPVRYSFPPFQCVSLSATLKPTAQRPQLLCFLQNLLGEASPWVEVTVHHLHLYT